MDWAGIAQRIGTATDIIGGKKSYTDVKLDQAAVMDRRAKMAMDAHNVARAEQYDLDKERIRAAREIDLARMGISAADKRALDREAFERGEAEKGREHVLLRDDKGYGQQKSMFSLEQGGRKELQGLQFGHDILKQGREFGQQDLMQKGLFAHQGGMLDKEYGYKQDMQDDQLSHQTYLQDLGYEQQTARDATQHGYAKELQGTDLASRERVASLIQQNVQGGNGGGMVPPEILISMGMSPTTQVPWRSFGEMVDLQKLKDARAEFESRRRFVDNLLGKGGGITAPTVGTPLLQQPAQSQPAFLGKRVND